MLGDYGPAGIQTGRGLPFEDRLDLGFEPITASVAQGNSSPVQRACEYAGHDGDSLLLFFPFEGLGQVRNGVFEWVDRSEPFRRMERLAGVDSQGRIYLVSAPAVMSDTRSGGRLTGAGDLGWWAYPAEAPAKNSQLWVYRRAAPLAPSPVRALIPVVSLPAMDSKQRVWFLPLMSSPASPWPRGPAALGDTPAAEAGAKALTSALSQTVPPPPPTSAFPIDLEASGWTTALCCYDAGKITVGATNVPFHMVLMPGASGSLLGYSWTTKVPKAFLLDESGLTWADSLHRLAQDNPARLLRAAPAQAQPSARFVPNFYFSEKEYPAIARNGECLWIHQGGRIEAYRNGQPMGIQERLTLLNCPKELSLHGPASTRIGPAMVIVGSGGRSSSSRDAVIFWAVSTNNDIQLVRGPAKPAGLSHQLPLVNPLKGTVYIERFVSPASFWKVSPPEVVEEGQGVPLWLNGQGELLTRLSSYGYEGWRLERDEAVIDLPIAYTCKLRVLHETRNGRVLCQSPEGLLWLRRIDPGDYVFDAELPLNTGAFALSFVGETDAELFLTVVDARQNAYLAVLLK